VRGSQSSLRGSATSHCKFGENKTGSENIFHAFWKTYPYKQNVMPVSALFYMSMYTACDILVHSTKHHVIRAVALIFTTV